MSEVVLVIKEQLQNWRIILRLSRYEEKANYQSHYLGLLWQVLNPIIQIGIYYLVFGLGVNGGREVAGVPFIIWMLIGLVPWFFISKTLLGASASIYRQVTIVAKMKFPISILPTNNMISNLSSYFPMMAFLIILLTIFGVYPTVYWLQFFYYFLAMILFLYACSLVNSTISTLIRDYQIVLQSVIRLLFYVSGAIWDIDNRNLPVTIVKVLKLNPLYYLVEGFRDTFISRQWFWQKGTYSLIFWGITVIFLIVGSHLHLKFRRKFTDLV